MDIAHIADLAKLEISDERLKTLEKEMDGIVKMVENMPGAEDAPPLPAAPLAALREDVVAPSFPRGEMLAGAPGTAEGLVLAPKTLEG